MPDQFKDFAYEQDGYGYNAFARSDDYARLLELRPELDLDLEKTLMRKDSMRPVQDRWRKKIEGLLAESEIKGEAVQKTKASYYESLGRFALTLPAIVAQLENLTPNDGEVFVDPGDYRSSPRNFAKMAQDLFSPEFAYQELNDDQIGSIIIDPEKITPEMMKRLGLSLNLGSNTRNKSLLLAQNYPAAIEELKNFLVKLEPIQTNYSAGRKASHFRVYRIGYGEKEGQLLGTDNPYSLNSERDKSVKTFFITDYFNAIQRLNHILDSNESESLELARLSRKIQYLWDLIESGTQPEIYKQKAEVINTDIEKFNGPIDHNRREIANKLPKIITLRDSIDRNNPAALQARLLSIDKFIKQRMRALSKISGYIDTDKSYLAPIVENETIPLAEIYKKFLSIGDRLLTLRKVAITPARYIQIATNLTAYKSELGTISIEPFKSFAKSITVIIDQILIKICDLPEDEQATAIPYNLFAKDVADLFLELKLAKFYTEFSELEFDLVNPSNLNKFKVFDLLKRLNQILADLKDVKLISEVAVTKASLFTNIYKRVNKIRAIIRSFLAETNSRPATIDFKIECYASIKIEFKELLREIHS